MRAETRSTGDSVWELALQSEGEGGARCQSSSTILSKRVDQAQAVIEDQDI